MEIELTHEQKIKILEAMIDTPDKQKAMLDFLRTQRLDFLGDSLFTMCFIKKLELNLKNGLQK